MVGSWQWGMCGGSGMLESAACCEWPQGQNQAQCFLLGIQRLQPARWESIPLLTPESVWAILLHR